MKAYCGRFFSDRKSLRIVTVIALCAMVCGCTSQNLEEIVGFGKSFAKKANTGPIISGEITVPTLYNSLLRSPSVSWNPASSDSSIVRYEIAVGTTSGASDTAAWTDVGNVTTYFVVGLSLTKGVTYYPQIRATDLKGVVGRPVIGSGWMAVPCDPTISVNFGGGDGTALNPYRVCSLPQWNYFGNTPSSWSNPVQLESNLDFTGVSFVDFKMIGTAVTPFIGNFNGNGFKIANLNVNGGASSLALFPETGAGAVIKNLSLEAFNFTSSGKMAALVINHAAGNLDIRQITVDGLTYSRAASGLVDTSNGSITATSLDLRNITAIAGAKTGGVVGILRGSSSFTNVSLTNLNQTKIFGFANQIGGIVGFIQGTAAPITVSISGVNLTIVSVGDYYSDYVGGLVGEARDANVLVSNSTVGGTIAGKSSAGLVGLTQNWFSTSSSLSISNSSFNGSIPYGNNGTSGGLVGTHWASMMTISNCFSKGSGSTWTGLIGGIVGQASGATTISDSYSNMSLTSTGVNGGGTTGGLIGTSSGASAVSLQRSFYAGIMTNGDSSARGCVVGANFAPLTVSDVYFDSTNCSRLALNGGALVGTVGLATSSIQTATAFTNWLPSNWTFQAGLNPRLATE